MAPRKLIAEFEKDGIGDDQKAYYFQLRCYISFATASMEPDAQTGKKRAW